MIADGMLEIQEAAQEKGAMAFDSNSRWIFDPTQGALDLMPYPWGHGAIEQQQQGHK